MRPFRRRRGIPPLRAVKVRVSINKAGDIHLPDPKTIEEDMAARKAQGIIRFDLTGDEFFEHPEKFWAEFKHTGQILVPEDLEKWLIGQPRMKEEFFLNLEEWVRKRLDVQKMREKGMADDKDAMKKFLKERPGPYLLYIGEPGTGKSLLIKIANKKLKELYKKYGIKLQDVLLIPDPANKQKSKVRYVPAGMGKRIVDIAEIATQGESIKTRVIRSFLGFVVLIGVLMIITAIMLMIYIGATSNPDVAWFIESGTWLQWLFYGMMMMVFPLMILWMTGQGGYSGIFSKSGARLKNVPSLAVDNGGDPDLYVDMTQANTSHIFGSVQHDPWQSGGLGTPTHHRMQAGVIHKADGKIMYFDEIKNFLMQEATVIEFLTVMEDGAYPIRGRSWIGGEGNASLAGESEPIDANFMIIAAGNYDSLPALDHYPALRDRFYYGNIVRAEDEVDASPLYQMQVAQFIADEVYRFKLPAVCEQGVKTIIGHARRRASSADKMKLMMRSYIQDLKKAGQFVWAKKEVGPCSCGIDDASMIHSPHIMLAINDYAKPIEMQILDAQIKTRKPYKMMKNTGAETGQVNGLVVVGGSTGDVMSASAYVQELPLEDGPNGTKVPRVGVFEQTGLPVTDKDTWMQNSIRLVRTTIFKIYGIDLMRGYYTHIAFDQSDPKGVDGPSAGITMTLAIMSCLGDPRLPKEQRQPISIRMDTAVTGTIENLPAGENDVRVGPIGGTFEKVYGAAKNGMKRVVIPKENYQHNYFESPLFKGVEVKMASSVLEYLDLMRADKEEGT